MYKPLSERERYEVAVYNRMVADADRIYGPMSGREEHTAIKLQRAALRAISLQLGRLREAEPSQSDYVLTLIRSHAAEALSCIENGWEFDASKYFANIEKWASEAEND